MKSRHILYLLTFLFSINSSADPNEDLLRALQQQNFEEATRIFSEHEKTINVDYPVSEGEFRGATALWFAARSGQWQLVMRMLILNPNANLNAQARGRLHVRRYILERGPRSILKLLAIGHMNSDVQGEDLAKRLEGRNQGPDIVEDLERTFRKATVAFTNLIEDSGIQEESGFDKLPGELKTMFVLRYLRADDPDLVKIPDDMLLTLVARFHKVYKNVDYKGRSAEVVAAKVLSRLAPIEGREGASVTRLQAVLKVRDWIVEEMAEAVRTNVLPERLDQNMRDRLTMALSSKTPSNRALTGITRKWVKETIAKVAEQRRRQEAPEEPNIKKRDRGEEGDGPHEDESAPKAQVPAPS